VTTTDEDKDMTMWKRSRHPIGRLPLLDGASRDVVQRLGSLMTPFHLPAGEVLVTEGKRNVQFVLLESGTVSVTRAGEQIAQLGAGDFVGEVSLLGGGVANATVTTTTPIAGYVSTSREFAELLDSTVGPTIQATAAERRA
jgi:CRP-like cAMP-binding protein